MRLLLKFRFLNNCSYDTSAYHKFQGFIYRQLIGTPYEKLHDKPGYKFFCFSNLFPVGDPPKTIKENETRSFIISSPASAMIKLLAEKIRKQADGKEPVNIGEYRFLVEDLRTIDVRLHSSPSIASATPITMRIPEERYGQYGIVSEFRKRRYVYWRPQYDFSAFVKQLDENLIKKYNDFHGLSIEEQPIFEQYNFKKSVCCHAVENGIEQEIVGSIWNFSFSHLSPWQRKILEFGLDCGFGERNSLGFGFVNVLRERI